MSTNPQDTPHVQGILTDQRPSRLRWDPHKPRLEDVTANKTEPAVHRGRTTVNATTTQAAHISVDRRPHRLGAETDNRIGTTTGTMR